MLGFIQRVAHILVQHVTTGLQTLIASVTPIGSPSVDVILSSIAPYLVALPFMSME